MHKLIFATNNKNKVLEVRSILGNRFSILSLKEAGINITIPEPHNTLEDNAAEKAQTIFNLTGTHCFSEDTGLEVASLNNLPGVHSARYAGNNSTDEQNIAKLLHNLTGKDRRARFRTVICLIWDSKKYFFEGICEGSIATTPFGNSGFGYDPIFIPKDGNNRTFAQMTIEEKNHFSHRKKATNQLIQFLQQYGQNKA